MTYLNFPINLEKEMKMWRNCEPIKWKTGMMAIRGTSFYFFSLFLVFSLAQCLKHIIQVMVQLKYKLFGWLIDCTIHACKFDSKNTFIYRS
jgi:hypothetical protein